MRTNSQSHEKSECAELQHLYIKCLQPFGFEYHNYLCNIVNIKYLRCLKEYN